MKKLLLLLPFIVLAWLVSCDKGTSEPGKVVPVDSLQPSSAGLTDSFRVNADFSYNISITPAGSNWLQARLSNATSPPYLVITVQPNTVNQSRTAYVQISSSSGEVIQTIKVIQEAYTGPLLLTDVSQILLPGYIHAARSFTIQSNTGWTISIQPTGTLWFSADQTSGSGNKTIEIKSLENYTGTANRTAELVITPQSGSGLSPVIVQVTQQPILLNQPWSKTYSGSYPVNWFNAMIKTADNGILTAGFIGITSATTTWQSDGWLMKHDAQGNQLWQKQYGGSNGDQANAVCVTADGGYVFAGFATSNDGDLAGLQPQNGDYWMVKTDGAGNKVWLKAYGGDGFDNAKAIAATPDGGYIVCGETNSINGDVTGNHGGKDVWLIKLDAAGNKSWQKCLGGSSDDNGTGVAVMSDGSIVVTATIKSNDGDVTGAQGGISDGWVVKLSSSGIIQWTQVLGSIFEDEAHAVIITSANEVVVAGHTASYIPGWRFNGDMMIVKLNGSTGAKIWERAMGSFELDKALAVQQTMDGGYILTGFVSQAGGDVQSAYTGGLSDCWLVKTDAQANIEWQKTLGGIYEDKAYGLIELSANNYIVTGVKHRMISTPTSNQAIIEAWINRVDEQ